jgi:ATP-binding protein involved in chromosome partitioning
MKVAAADALRGIKMFEKLDVPIIGIVENMSGDFFGTGAGEDLSARYNCHFLGKIPLEANVRIGGDSGEPIVISHPDSEAAQAFATFTQEVAARTSVLTLANQANVIPIQMIG